MNLGILSCGRSDYSIYRPLLQKARDIASIKVDIIAFGSHNYKEYGSTINELVEDSLGTVLPILHKIDNSSPKDNASSMADTMDVFSAFWSNTNYDIVLVLGDRYEMFAAAAASVPFQIPLGHLHGGEKSEGAMDDIFRDAISHMSSLHFTTCETHKERVSNLVKVPKATVFNFGSLGVEGMQSTDLFGVEDIKATYGVDLSIPTILATVHPETKGKLENERNINQLLEALDSLNDQVLFTLPNNDFDGALIRKKIETFCKDNDQRFCFESLGVRGYYSVLRQCSFLVGNSSSGIIEAASFGKYVLNLGARQLGRECSDNVSHCPFESKRIIESVNEIRSNGAYLGTNIYDGGSPSEKILEVLENFYGN